MAFMRPAPPAQTSPQALDELGGISQAPAAGAQPDDAFSEADLLTGNAGLDPQEVSESQETLSHAARRATAAA
jgi:hypothetical protein